MKKRKPAFVNYPPVAGWNRLPENMALVGVIRRHRLRLGLSQNKLSDLTRSHLHVPQVSRQMLGFFEADKYLLGPDALGHVARALGTTIADLYFEAQRRIAQLPDRCHACKYLCIGGGELKWLSGDRICVRPAPTPSPAMETPPPGLP